MTRKTIKKTHIHQIPAGILQGDFKTELFADRKTRRVFLLHNGKTQQFKELGNDLRAKLLAMLLNDPKAMEDLSHLPIHDALEKYAFCLYGSADSKGDFDEHGNLAESENFMCSNNCQCLKWKNKTINIHDQVLTYREIQIIRLLPSDKPDKQIAAELGMKESTLDSHKNNIFKKFGVHSKAGLITEAINHKIIQ